MPRFRRIIVLFALGALLMGTLYRAPVTSDFIHYLVWRWTTKAVVAEGFARTRDADIHYVSYGSGPALLLLHGGLSNRLSWFAQLPWLVEAGCRVVVIDTRGHGQSGPGEGELSYRLLASDAIAVLDKLGIEKSNVIGWSDGGNTALMLGLYWPRRVLRIVTISANFSPAGLTPEAQNETLEPSRGLAYWFRRFWTGAGDRLRALEARVVRMWHRLPNLQPADLDNITAPTLVIVGEKDIVSIAHARQMAKCLSNGTLAVVPGGHFTPITRAERIKGLIADFLAIGVTSSNTPKSVF